MLDDELAPLTRRRFPRLKTPEDDDEVLTDLSVFVEPSLTNFEVSWRKPCSHGSASFSAVAEKKQAPIKTVISHVATVVQAIGTPNRVGRPLETGFLQNS
jgi:hypothetical protein